MPARARLNSADCLSAHSDSVSWMREPSALGRDAGSSLFGECNLSAARPRAGSSSDTLAPLPGAAVCAPTVGRPLTSKA
jgi:hypothetical protein